MPCDRRAGPFKIGGDQAADRDPVRAGRVEWQPLAVLAQDGLELRHRHAGLDRDRHIGRLVINQAVQPVQTQGHIVAPGPTAQVQKRAEADRGDREFVLAGATQVSETCSNEVADTTSCGSVPSIANRALSVTGKRDLLIDLFTAGLGDAAPARQYNPSRVWE